MILALLPHFLPPPIFCICLLLNWKISYRLTSSFLNSLQTIFSYSPLLILHYKFWQDKGLNKGHRVLARCQCHWSEPSLFTWYRWRLRVLPRACSVAGPADGFCWRSWSWSELFHSARASAWGEGEGQEEGVWWRMVDYLGLQTLRLVVTENSL